jgi:hypothetical protein
MRNICKWANSFFYLCEGKRRREEARLQEIMFLFLFVWTSGLTPRRTYHSYAPSILTKPNPKYLLHSSKVVHRWQFDSTPPSRQNASLYSPRQGSIAEMTTDYPCHPTYERVWNSVTMGYSIPLHITLQEPRIVDDRGWNRFDGRAQNHPKIWTRSCGQK